MAAAAERLSRIPDGDSAKPRGQPRWHQPVALAGTGLESPAVPVYHHGVVYVGVSGKEQARGHLDAFDAGTGKRMWRSFLVCARADVAPRVRPVSR
jgi:outer membrane protein assembly factor BamB